MSSEFQEIIRDYSNIESIENFNLDTKIQGLTQPSSSSQDLSSIRDYYDKIHNLNTRVMKYLTESSKKISNAQDTLINEVRYEDRVRPQETTVSREVMYGAFPKFKESTLPYVLSAGVFMALLTIFLILQALGINGQFSLPQSIIGFFVSPAGTVSVPFYKNPMVLGGLVAILGSALIIFIILYFNKKS